ncbi:hypothetical protein [Plantactinospora mayteni]|uniref:hypothetical protein n=1 Tax=Plantactinospora mayteni TaxID=566021 RepID=UPI001941D17D|nr:hypothetical protein [Plantactinospora mayteni]
MRRLLVTLALVASTAPLLGCGEDGPSAADPSAGAPGPTAGASTPGTGAGPVTATGAAAEPAATCAPEVRSADGPPEVRGVANAGNSFWGLLFPRGGPSLTTGRDEKIVWRMTGSGTLSIRATGPGGVTIEPVWGPSGHSGSTWTRPGDEWGTGWNFPTAGCWTVRASRSGGATGSAVLRVG